MSTTMTMTGVRPGVGADAMELDLLAGVGCGAVKLAGEDLRCALRRERELLGVLADMQEQGLIACEVRFGLTAEGSERLAELAGARSQHRGERDGAGSDGGEV